MDLRCVAICSMCVSRTLKSAEIDCQVEKSSWNDVDIGRRPRVEREIIAPASTSLGISFWEPGWSGKILLLWRIRRVEFRDNHRIALETRAGASRPFHSILYTNRHKDKITAQRQRHKCPGMVVVYAMATMMCRPARNCLSWPKTLSRAKGRIKMIEPVFQASAYSVQLHRALWNTCDKAVIHGQRIWRKRRHKVSLFFVCFESTFITRLMHSSLSMKPPFASPALILSAAPKTSTAATQTHKVSGPNLKSFHNDAAMFAPLHPPEFVLQNADN
jgi:hypothetical protein